MTINIGSHVTVADDDRHTEKSFRMVSGSGSPSAGTLSSSSPVGRALYGHGVGDTVAVQVPSGTRHLRVIAIA